MKILHPENLSGEFFLGQIQKLNIDFHNELMAELIFAREFNSVAVVIPDFLTSYLRKQTTRADGEFITALIWLKPKHRKYLIKMTIEVIELLATVDEDTFAIFHELLLSDSENQESMFWDKEVRRAIFSQLPMRNVSDSYKIKLLSSMVYVTDISIPQKFFGGLRVQEDDIDGWAYLNIEYDWETTVRRMTQIMRKKEIVFLGIPFLERMFQFAPTGRLLTNTLASWRKMIGDPDIITRFAFENQIPL